MVLPRVYNGRNRTFFFLDYEGFRQSIGTSSNFTVPTDLQRRGDFSRTTTSGGQLVVIYNPFSVQTLNGVQTRSPFPGNVIPQNLLSPVALNLQKFYPESNNTRLTSNYQVAPAVYNANNSAGARIDHNFTDRHRIFGRFSIQYPDTGAANFYDNIANFGPPPLRQRRYHDSLQDVYTITPTMILNVNYGFFRQFGTRQSLSEGFDITTLGFNPNFHAGQQIQAIPLISITGFSGLGNASQNAGAQMGHSLSGSVTKSPDATPSKRGPSTACISRTDTRISPPMVRSASPLRTRRGRTRSKPALPRGMHTPPSCSASPAVRSSTSLRWARSTNTPRSISRTIGRSRRLSL